MEWSEAIAVEEPGLHEFPIYDLKLCGVDLLAPAVSRQAKVSTGVAYLGLPGKIFKMARSTTFSNYLFLYPRVCGLSAL